MATDRMNRLLSHEPPVPSWHPAAISSLIAALTPSHAPRPVVIAVDGRGGSGKTTISAAIAAAHERSFVVHTDDIAWHEPLFGWSPLLRHGILEPLRARQPIDFHPPAWSRMGRKGSIRIPVDLDLLIVEGTGSGDRTLTELVDALLWVQSDLDAAQARGIARDVAEGTNGNLDQATTFWHAWQNAEIEHLRNDRPWDRADAIVDGTPQNPSLRGELWVADTTPNGTGL